MLRVLSFVFYNFLDLLEGNLIEGFLDSVATEGTRLSELKFVLVSHGLSFFCCYLLFQINLAAHDPLDDV